MEGWLVQRIGEAGKRLHTARSRNDQVATDLRLFLREALVGRKAVGPGVKQGVGQGSAQKVGLRAGQEAAGATGVTGDGRPGGNGGDVQQGSVDDDIASLQRVLVELAERDGELILPGYTHLQRAQPILLGHHLLAYFWMLQRDRGRLADCVRRFNVSPLGSGALAGVPYPIDREGIARELGFERVSENSLDAVADRDFVVEALAALAIVMVHLSRLAEEIVLWASAEFGFIELADAYATGSSIMPQKKNPDGAELVRGKSGRVFGDLMALLTVCKGLPLAYNKDLQEDKEALFDALDTVRGSLQLLAPMLATARFQGERMAAAAQDGFLNATDLADYLVRRGVPFRQAHAMVGRAVRWCIDKGCRLEELTLDEMRTAMRGGQGLPAAVPIAEDVYQALDLRQVVAARQSPGGTGYSALAQELEAARRLLAVVRE
ncbi:MAG: argininosuccinate lyase [Limnochordaceae bacterium]|nr:argininosuccinate lyase [Limnochordaceae bacterium]